MSEEETDTLYIFDVRLTDCDTPVWRKIKVQQWLTLGGLHIALQNAVGWHRRLPFMFRIGEDCYGFPDNELEHPEGIELKDALEITVEEALERDEEIHYLYDPLEGGWEFEVIPQGTTKAGLGGHYPSLEDGAIAPPPENAYAKHYTKVMDFLTDEDGELPGDPELAAWRGWDPSHYEPEPFIPLPQALESQARQAVQHHAQFEGHGDEYQNHHTRTAIRSYQSDE